MTAAGQRRGGGPAASRWRRSFGRRSWSRRRVCRSAARPRPRQSWGVHRGPDRPSSPPPSRHLLVDTVAGAGLGSDTQEELGGWRDPEGGARPADASSANSTRRSEISRTTCRQQTRPPNRAGSGGSGLRPTLGTVPVIGPALEHILITAPHPLSRAESRRVTQRTAAWSSKHELSCSLRAISLVYEHALRPLQDR